MFEKLLDYINRNPGKAFGFAIGFLFGLLIMIFGIKVIWVILFSLIGIFLGRMLDSRGKLKDVGKKFPFRDLK